MLLPEHTFGELIPGPDLPESVTSYRAKMLAAENDETVTTEQFDAFRRVGLTMSPRQDGRFDGRVVNQLIAIKRAGRQVRPLARRVVFLRAYYLLFPVSADKLQQALSDMTPMIEGAARKLARMSRWGRSPGTQRFRHAPLPRVKEWEALLRGASPELIDAWAPGWYAMARDAIPAYYAPRVSPLDDIPLEEQVLLLAIVDLNRRRAEADTVRT